MQGDWLSQWLGDGSVNGGEDIEMEDGSEPPLPPPPQRRRQPPVPGLRPVDDAASLAPASSPRNPGGQEWLRRRVDEVRNKLPRGGTPDRRRHVPSVPGLPIQASSSPTIPRGSPIRTLRRTSSPQGLSSTSSERQQTGAGRREDGFIPPPPQPPQEQAQHDTVTERQFRHATERLREQESELELLRHKLAHAQNDADAARAAAAGVADPLSSGQVPEFNYTSTGNKTYSDTAFFKEQLRRARQEAAAERAEREQREHLLVAALERPPQQRPPPVSHSSVQTAGLDTLDLILGDDDEDEDNETIKANAGGRGITEEDAAKLVANIRNAVKSEVEVVLEKQKDTFFLGGVGGLRGRDNEKGEVTHDKTARRISMSRMSSMPQSAEEVFYEMCAGVAEVKALGSTQEIQVENARNFMDLMDDSLKIILWPWGDIDDFDAMVTSHDVLRYLVQSVRPHDYCNNPVGFLFLRVLRSSKDAARDRVVQADAYQLTRQGLANVMNEHSVTAPRLDETEGRDEAPALSSWTDLAKKIIVLLSQPKFSPSLDPSFTEDDPRHPGKSRRWNALEFAVEHRLDELVLQLCDVQERLPDDAWKVGPQGKCPLHFALEHGQARASAINRMLRAAGSVPDDRFGLLYPTKLRLHKRAEEQVQSSGMQPLYIALMFCAEVPGVVDTVMNLLQKPGRAFKINFRWTGYHETLKETWHLLQWAAFQGVHRIFEQYHHHPDFSGHFLTAGDSQKELTPIHLACISGSHEVVDIICREIGKQNTPTEHPWVSIPTPFHYAAQQCHWRCLAVMLAYAKDKWDWGLKVNDILFGHTEEGLTLGGVRKLTEGAA
eukprot:Hpha_TRINITY_DN27180_c0_g1::TRINITY_DN27180_c0_g1_i1::g.29252::m.29252